MDADPGPALYQQFARIGKTLAHPKRIELLHLLGQGERGVEALAAASGLALTTASAHLQLLRHARLVETRRDGVKVLYRIADDSVYRLLVALQDAGRARLAEVQQIARDSLDAGDSLAPMSRQELWRRIRRGDVTVIDTRPAEEFRAGHIPHARSLPVDQLPAGLRSLPRKLEIVAYCRGPYCVLAPQAVRLLRSNRFRARRLEDGFPEWRLAGLPVEAAAS